ncbi:MAG: tripartite tricarboxylate transporter substrate binding protein [Spirochaetia bacterium]|jgi:tripartite-type tricarboxylate transporter receptor subunit TctC|nr:tripartite tricarboxylate transporter substrate binding protein [Spirochaetia bacterium]
MKGMSKVLSLMTVMMVCALSVISASGQQESKENLGTGYPTRTIQVIIPVGAGGDTDTNARIFSQYLEKELGQTLAVVNVKGGGGTIGMQRVLDAKPDGYTVLFYHGEAMIPKIAGLVDYGIDAFDMVGIGLVDNTTVLATHPGMPFSDMKGFVSYAKAHPGEVEFGMMTGGYPELVGLAIEDTAKIDLNLVDVGANAAKTVALKARKTDVINTQYGLTQDYFKNGDFIMLGLTSPERNPLIPDIPTTAEQGYPLDFNKFFFFAMPKGTPKAIIDKFSAAIKKVVEDPDFKAEVAKHYLTPTYMGPEEASKHAQETYDYFLKYQDLFRTSGK